MEVGLKDGSWGAQDGRRDSCLKFPFLLHYGAVMGVREGTSGTSGEVTWRRTQNGVELKTSKRKVKKNVEIKQKQEKPETP